MDKSNIAAVQFATLADVSISVASASALRLANVECIAIVLHLQRRRARQVGLGRARGANLREAGYLMNSAVAIANVSMRVYPASTRALADIDIDVHVDVDIDLGTVVELAHDRRHKCEGTDSSVDGFHSLRINDE